MEVIPLTSDLPQHQVANCHIAIKVVNAACFLPFTRAFARLMLRLLPGDDLLDASPHHIDYGPSEDPRAALQDAALEIRRMAVSCVSMVRDAVSALVARDETTQDMVLKRESIVDDLYRIVTEFVVHVSRAPLPPELASRPALLLHIMSDVERIGDHAENIVELGEAYSKPEARFTDDAKQDIAGLLEALDALAEVTLNVMTAPSADAAPAAHARRADIDSKADQVLRHHKARLASGRCSSTAAIVFDELVMNLRRVANHLLNIAAKASGA
jgi:phosphate:Na+ symporter